jgi:uncharacterized membrane protein
MLKASTVVTINKPVEHVFKVVGTDYFQNHPKWDPRNIKTELQGPMAKGAKGTETRKDGGRTMTYNFEVTEFQPNKQVRFDAKGGPVTFSGIYGFQPAGNATQLSVDFQMRMGGLLRIFELFMGGGFRKDVTLTGTRIKDFVEKQ